MAEDRVSNIAQDDAPIDGAIDAPDSGDRQSVMAAAAIDARGKEDRPVPPWHVPLLVNLDHDDTDALPAEIEAATRTGATALRLVHHGAFVTFEAKACLTAVISNGLALSLDGYGRNGLELAQKMVAAASSEAASVSICCDLDPFHGAARGAMNSDPVGLGAEMIAAMPRIREAFPQSMIFAADGRWCHDGGGDAVLELAVILAETVEILRFGGESDREAIWSCLRPIIVVDQSMIRSLAKIRALALLRTAIADACGITVALPLPAAAMSWRMLTYSEPWNNIPRLTLAAAAAVSSEISEIIIPSPRIWGRGEAVWEDRRLARNIALMLHHEAGFDRHADPACGATVIETEVRRLAAAAWEQFQQIENRGGLSAALISGSLARQIFAARKQEDENIASGNDEIVGVTRFAALLSNLEEHERAPRHAPIAPLAAHIESIVPGRREDAATNLRGS